MFCLPECSLQVGSRLAIRWRLAPYTFSRCVDVALLLSRRPHRHGRIKRVGYVSQNTVDSAPVISCVQRWFASLRWMPRDTSGAWLQFPPQYRPTSSSSSEVCGWTVDIVCDSVHQCITVGVGRNLFGESGRRHMATLGVAAQQRTCGAQPRSTCSL